MGDLRQQAEAGSRILELSTLYEISKLLGSSLDLTRNLNGSLRILSSFMGMHKCMILLCDPRTGELSIRLALGMAPEEIARGKYQRGEGILGKVVQHGVPIVIPDIEKEPDFVDRTGSRKDPAGQPVACIAVPIKLRGESIGVLSVDRPFEGTHSFEEDLRVLAIVASLIGQAVGLQEHIRREREGVIEQVRSRDQLDGLVGRSRRMQEIYDAVEQVSRSRATVLIRGESGTGKEMIARAIHYGSPRASGPFVRINCAALPQALLESELFGHEKGAFTGAVGAKKGRFELADGGSLFLDEIGDLPSSVQVKLLRVLQERCFERVGGTRTILVDVRIIAATHQNLEAAIARGDFREDLYYRLNVVPLHLPPLRERREDIPLLIEHFLAKANRENNRKVRITGRLLKVLLDHDWPGNVRELENCIERMVIMSRRGLVVPEDQPLIFEPAPRRDDAAQAVPLPMPTSPPSRLRDLERAQIVQALRRANGVQARAAELLGITPRQLAYRLQKYGIVRAFRVVDERTAIEA